MTSFKDKNIAIGDMLCRMHDNTPYNATVKEITAEQVVCQVIADQPRTMRFDIQTGINVLGSEYGYLTHYTNQ